MRGLNHNRTIRLVTLLLLAAVFGMLVPRAASADPILIDPRFQVSIFGDLAPLGRLKAFQLTVTSGENGFPAGLYVTSGPAPDDRSDRLVRIDALGQPTVVKSGFTTNEGLLFARGAYGDGMLITEPQLQRIDRLLSDGTRPVFTNGFTPPF